MNIMSSSHKICNASLKFTVPYTHKHTHTHTHTPIFAGLFLTASLHSPFPHQDLSPIPDQQSEAKRLQSYPNVKLLYWDVIFQMNQRCQQRDFFYLSTAIW
uniref:Uncharacterized protein n=1 Tax=Micrurus lemniscatus lemniscatus TaxID=129467 RepID=A0A2D4JQL7_MICLE